MDLDKSNLSPTFSSLSDFVQKSLLPSAYAYYYALPTNSSQNKKSSLSSPIMNANERAIRMKQLRSFYSSAIFGNDKMFRLRWRQENVLTDPEYFSPQNWTHMYDHTPIIKTLDKFIDYDKLRPNGNSKSRLILTAVNLLNSEPFDI